MDDEPTPFPVEVTPFSYLSPCFDDDDNNQMENMLSPTFQGVTPLQTVDDNNQMENMLSPTFQGVTPLQTVDDNNQMENMLSPTFQGVTPLQTVDDNNQMENMLSPTFQGATPLQTVDDNNQMENMLSPIFQGVTPLQTVDDNETHYTATPPIPLPSPLQPPNEETYNTPAPFEPILVVTPLRTLVPSGEPSTVEVDPSIGPSKRGRGRPKGSKNSKPSKKKMETCQPNTEMVASPHHLVDTNPLAIVPYDDSNNNNNSLADDAAAVPSSGGPLKRGRGRPKGSKNSNPPMKKVKPYDPEDRTVISCPSFDVMITEEEKENGNQELVDSVMMRFNAVRRHLVQVNCGKAVLTTAFSSFNNLGVRTNRKKRVGPVPGIEVGAIFYYWGEMCLVGLHTQMPAGIDYLLEKDGEAEGLATSVVTSGHYNDKTDELQSLIYTGQGGVAKDGTPRHQELKRGNLALKISKEKGNDVRVIRGIEDPDDRKRKVYIYDGLYVVSAYWIEKGTTGFDEYKFNLVRKQDQPPGYATWKLVEEWMKRGSTHDDPRKGFVIEDLSLGNEKLHIPVVNEIDENDKDWPFDFTYVAASPISLITMPDDVVTNHQPNACDSCQGKPCGGDTTCPCIQRNGGVLPYDNRVLIYRKPMIYECGQLCSCPPECKNRLTQGGLKIRLELFKTEKCGWGLRAWEPIRAGTFICELVGTPKRREEIEEDDEYVFDTSRVCKSFTWNYEPELVGEDCWDQISEAYKLPSEILVSARWNGNVSRFMNHSCSGNVMWQPVQFEKDGQTSFRIAFFAKKNIPPLTELRYDYGMSHDTGEFDGDGLGIFIGKKFCLCGSENCRGSFE